MTGEPIIANAWRGAPAGGIFGPGSAKWGMGELEIPVKPLAPPDVDPWDWRHEAIGWGIVLPDTDRGTSADRAAAKDAPEALQQLVVARGQAPVLRWRRSSPDVLFRYYPGFAEPEQIPIGGTPRGIAPGAIPAFLMLCGDLADLPWTLQYRLGTDPRLCPGRLPLTGEALDRYVTRLLTTWDKPAPSRARAVVWATDHAPTDITRLMRLVIADPIHGRYDADADIDVVYHLGDAATGDNLAGALTAGPPHVVVTTSHGFTGPAGQPDAARLGWLVDAGHTEIDPATLLTGWQPDGAVWYAHACCGAGADDLSTFAGVFQPGSRLDTMVTEVATLGRMVAPLPVALLSAPSPARAFIGHVEPTYDWTLRHSPSKHALTSDLTEALYTRLMLGRPVGWAFKDWLTRAGADAADHHDKRELVLSGKADAVEALRARLSFLDRRSLVVLGDPAVALPSTRQT